MMWNQEQMFLVNHQLILMTTVAHLLMTPSLDDTIETHDVAHTFKVTEEKISALKSDKDGSTDDVQL